jgi:WD40 repeat protein
VIGAVAITPDGKRIISGAWDGTLKVWDLEKCLLSAPVIGHTHPVHAVAITPDRQRAISASSDGTVKTWNLQNGTELSTQNIQYSQKIIAFVFNEGKTQGISASSSMKTLNLGDLETGKLNLWDLERGNQLKTFIGHEGWVAAVAVTSDRQKIISGASDQTLKIWDIQSGTELHTLKGHSKYVQAVTITPNGHCAISASDDCTLKVWEIESGKELHTLKGHEDRVWALAVTPDGKKVVSASWDSTLKVWDLTSGRELHTLKGHRGQVIAVSVTYDGLKAISASSDRTLKIWDLEEGRIIAGFSSDSTLLTCTVAADNATLVAGDILGRVHFLRLEGIDRFQAQYFSLETFRARQVTPARY